MRTPALVSLLLALAGTGGLVACPAHALDALDDTALQEVSGAGIAIALDDFEFAMAPTSYFEQVGSNPSNLCSATLTTNCWRRGDLRWYGINISGATNTGYHWNDTTTCSATSLNCPRGGVIDQFSPFDNPYIIRAWSPQGMAHDGNCVNGTGGGCSGSAPKTKAIYEFLAPTSQPNYTFSWWGEIETGSTRNSATQALATNAGTVLKSQSIIRGNAAGSVFRLFQFTKAGDETFGMFYHSRLKGDYRISIAQDTGATGYSDAIGRPTVFADTEGMYFRGVDAFIPLGQLYYQALTVNTVGTAGNFEIALTPIPDTALVYNKHYALNSDDTEGYETARMNNTGGTTTADYKLTHGYSRWGGWTATGTPVGRNLINGSDGSATGDGVIFMACAGCGTFNAFAKRPAVIDKRGETGSMQRTQNYNCSTADAGGCVVPGSAGGPTVAGAGDSTRTFPTTAVNLGDARIEGLMFNSLRFESCAAGGC